MPPRPTIATTTLRPAILGLVLAGCALATPISAQSINLGSFVFPSGPCVLCDGDRDAAQAED